MRYLVLALTLFLGLPAGAGTKADCGDLVQQSVADTEINQASLVTDSGELPDYCNVEGAIAGRVRFVMRLPVADWNGKFVVAGCGGFCGSLRPEKPGYSNSINEALKLGYAAIQTDGGHQAKSWDTDWAIGDPEALDLYAGTWMPLAVATGDSLVSAYYADDPSRTYFSGCSNGGRLGMYAAQRYPELFDGIAAGGGIFDLTGNSGVHGLWLLQSTRDYEGRAVIDQSKMPMLSQHIIQQCDALDGASDGVISRPELCSPAVDGLQCKGDDIRECFTSTELVAIKRLYQGATVNGKQLFPGLPPGSESLWSKWVVGTDEQRGWGEAAAEGNLRLTYGVPSAEPFNPHDYVLADELDNLQKFAPVLNATNPDLSGLSKAGGKLFYYHGLADPLILQGRVRQYYSEAVDTLGKEKLDRVARFVMVPGHGHCWEKPGQVADDFNPLVVIDQWVESGKAPDSVIAGYSGEGASRTRKLCPYPEVATFTRGDVNQADNFDCRQP